MTKRKSFRPGLMPGLEAGAIGRARAVPSREMQAHQLATLVKKADNDGRS